jgi:hypothetical protein
MQLNIIPYVHSPVARQVPNNTIDEPNAIDKSRDPGKDWFPMDSAFTIGIKYNPLRRGANV